MVEQSGVEDLLHFLVAGEKLGNYPSTRVMLLHADRESLHTAQDQPALKWREDCSCGLLQKRQLLSLVRARANYDSTQSVAVAVEELRGRVHHQVGTQRDWLLEIRRHESVVHDEVNFSRVADFAHRADVGQRHERIGWCLDKDQASLLRKRPFDVADV